jgi:hypothetical protein
VRCGSEAKVANEREREEATEGFERADEVM